MRQPVDASRDVQGRSAEQILNAKKEARFHAAKQGAIEAGYGQYENGLKEENSVGDSTALTRYAKAGCLLGVFPSLMKQQPFPKTVPVFRRRKPCVFLEAGGKVMIVLKADAVCNL